MNFLKWFGYVLLCGAFIWYVFIRDVHANDRSSETSTTKVASTPIEESQEPTEETFEDSSDSEEFTNTEVYFDEVTNTIEDTDEWTSEPDVVAEEPAIDIPNTNHISLDDSYLVIVGSFGSKRNATRLQKKVDTMGFDSEVSLINGLHRVIIASSTSEQNAKSVLSEYGQKSNGAPAFIMEQ